VTHTARCEGPSATLKKRTMANEIVTLLIAVAPDLST